MLRMHKRLVDYSAQKRQLFGGGNNDPFGPGFGNPDPAPSQPTDPASPVEPQPIGPNTPTQSNTSTTSTTSKSSTTSSTTSTTSSSTTSSKSSSTSTSTSTTSSSSSTSSSTTSSSSSSSSSTSSSKSSTTSSTIASVTPKVTPAPTTTYPSSHAIVTGHTTIYVPGGTNSTDLGAAPSTTSTPQSGISTAGIIGIAAAAILGIAILTGIIIMFVRRIQRRKDEFDADSFRRQSDLLNEDDPSPLNRAPSGRPRPPTMIERHYANLAAPAPSPAFNPPYTPASSYTASEMGYSPYQQSFGPGQVMPPLPPLPPTPSPIAPVLYPENPFYNPPTQSPAGSPTSVSHYNSAMNEQGDLTRQPSNGASVVIGGAGVQPVLTRSSSANSNNSLNGRNRPMSAAMDEPHYMDVNRASVTPFQAAQYVAISRQLNVPPPVPLVPVGEDEEMAGRDFLPDDNDERQERRRSDGAVSPFADPPRPLVVRNRVSTDTTMTKDSKAPVASAEPEDDMEELKPPKAAHARVDSNPPILPEIIHQRPFSPGAFSPINASFSIYPSGDKHSSDTPSATEYPQFPVSAHASMASAFTAADSSFSHDLKIPPGARHVPPSPLAGQGVTRPETVYDPEDAYGGF